MNSLYFWKDWNAPHKQLYAFLLTLFIVSLLALVYSYTKGIESVSPWEVQSELQPTNIVVGQFSKNMLSFSVEAEGYFALDKYVTTQIKINPVYTYIYLAFIIVAVVFLLTTFSFLELYWYLGALLGFLFFLFSLKIELLQLFGRTDRVPMVAIFLLFGGISYVFQSYYKSAGYLLRLTTFFILTLLTAFLIYRYSSAEAPFLYLAHFGSLFPLAIAIVFILVVGYDIIKGLLYVISGTYSVGSKNGVLNFTFASILYLGNLFLLLMKKLFVFELPILYVDAFLLLSISSIIGVWMFRKRTELFSTVLPFAPAGAYTYLSLAIIVIAGAGYALLTGNIGIIDAYERIIVYGHLFMGLSFFIYVMVNFLRYFDKKISIYEYVYKPERMSFWVVPAVAIAISSFVFLYQRKYPYHLAMAGYYSYAGDVMVHEKEYPLAYEYYKEALLYDYPNHRANYSIAALSHYLEEKETSKGYYENALLKDGSVQSYIGLSNAYIETGELFQAIFTIQEGLKKFPSDDKLYQNLGYLYYKTNLPDSAAHYFIKSKQAADDPSVAGSSLIYVLAKQQLYAEVDSILSQENHPKNCSFANNKLAAYTLLQKISSDSFESSFFNDSILNANTYAYLVNYSLNSLKTTDTVSLPLLARYAEHPLNESYKERLLAVQAMKQYYGGNRLEGIQQMQALYLANKNTSSPYASTMGHWFLEQEQYADAAACFKEVIIRPSTSTQVLNYAIAAAASGEKDEAKKTLVSLKQTKEQSNIILASHLDSVFFIKSVAEALKTSEESRAHYFLFSLNSLSTTDAHTLLKSFQNPQAKTICAVRYITQMIENADSTNAIAFAYYLQDEEGLNSYAAGERKYALTLLAALQNNNSILANLENLPAAYQAMLPYFKAVYWESTGDSTNAFSLYKKAMRSSPLSAFVLRRAVRYFAAHGKAQEVYPIVVEAATLSKAVQIQKVYLDLCIAMSLVSYAEATYEELMPSLTAKERDDYSKKIAYIQSL